MRRGGLYEGGGANMSKQKENAERLADKIIQALREDGFDAFAKNGYYDISEQVRPIIIKTIVDNE